MYSGTDRDAGTVPSIDQGPAGGRHPQGRGRARSRRPGCILFRGTRGCHRAACETARSPVLDRSPSKWHHSLQCASQLSEQLPIVSLHNLVCWHQPRRPAPRLAPSVILRATNIFDFELVFANRHILNLIRNQSCFRQTSSVSSGSSGPTSRESRLFGRAAIPRAICLSLPADRGERTYRENKNYV